MPAIAEPNRQAPLVPLPLVEVSLIDAEACAAAGGMSLTWWQDEVRAGRAPQPVVQRHRCTRWRLTDVREFWRQFAEAGAIDTPAAAAMRAKLMKAGAKARAQRGAKLTAA